MVIRFNRPVDIPIDRLADAVPDYVGSVRRDPDGSAIRLSLTRRVTINTMTAGERDFFAAFALEASDEELSEAGVLDIAAPFEEWPLHPVSSARALPDVQENCSRAALLRRRR